MEKPELREAGGILGSVAKQAREAWVAQGPRNTTGMDGYYLGSGDRAEAVRRLKRWVEVAEEHLSTEGIDQMAMRIVLYLNGEAFSRSGYGRKKLEQDWFERWEAEIAKDRKKRGVHNHMPRRKKAG